MLGVITIFSIVSCSAVVLRQVIVIAYFRGMRNGLNMQTQCEYQRGYLEGAAAVGGIVQIVQRETAHS